MKKITQTEWLMEWWTLIFEKKRSERYELLMYASKLYGGHLIPNKETLKRLRNRFVTDHVKRKRFPHADECFLCGWNKDSTFNRKAYFVRHHILSLSKGGSNRRINIVTLCTRCHSYFHSWLKDNSWIEKK